MTQKEALKALRAGETIKIVNHVQAGDIQCAAAMAGFMTKSRRDGYPTLIWSPTHQAKAAAKAAR